MGNGSRRVSAHEPGEGHRPSQHGRHRHLHRCVLTVVSAASIVGSMTAFAVVGAASAAPSSAPTITNLPRQAVAPPFAIHSTWASSNWSGYAETTGPYTGVNGTWTVPSVTASKSTSAAYSSVWIGVDGYNNSNLIQTGTEEDFYNGSAHYNAWWEILPASETALPTTSYPVAAGDRMTATISKTSGTVTTGSGHRRSTEAVWLITILDTNPITNQQNWTFSISEAYNGSGTSAEWIVEAPEVGGRIATLAPYVFGPPSNTGDFDNAEVQSSRTPSFSGANLNYSSNSGVMVQNKVQVSTPGQPDAAPAPAPNTAFNAAYGSVAPGAPTS